jgi:hypothetical protein
MIGVLNGEIFLSEMIELITCRALDACLSENSVWNAGESVHWMSVGRKSQECTRL